MRPSAGGDGQRSLAKRRICRARPDPAERVIDDVVQRDALGATCHHPNLHVVLQVVADAGRIQHDIDAVVLEQVRGSDPGELQQLRRVVGAAGDQDLLARLGRAQAAFLPVFDRPGAASLEQDALRQR